LMLREIFSRVFQRALQRRNIVSGSTESRTVAVELHVLRP
jgi:hypothetical protein